MAGIIKSGQLYEGPGTTQAAAFNFEDMTQKADSYLEAIRRQAAQILAQAKEQAGAVEREARERGRSEALREAEQLSRAELGQQMQTLLPALTKAVDSIRQSRESWMRHWEQNTVKLALAIAARVIRRELTRAPDITLDWVRESLELATGEGKMTILLNTKDFEVLGEQAQQLVDRLAPLGTAKVIADPLIEPGGCRLETEFGSIDQQLTAQLGRIEAELVD